MPYTPITVEQENLINKESPVFMRFRIGTYLRNLVAAVVTLTGVEKLTNKTLTSPVIDDGDKGIAITSANQTNDAPTATIPDIGDAADTFVMADTAQTLTNKTLNSPVIASPDVTQAVLAAIDTSAGDVVLNAAQAKCGILEVTTGHATNAIVAPTVAGKMYFIKNNDLATAVLIKTAAGAASVTIAATMAAVVYCNGTEYVRLTTDAQ